MSFLEPIRFDNDCIIVSKTISGSSANVVEFVNPQYTDKRYCTTQLGFMTPEPSPTDATLCRESFPLSENRSTYFSGSSAAASTISHSGCGTPSLSTPGSSASSSRRQSMLLPEGQSYLSGVPSSPSNRPRRPSRAAATDQCSLQESSTGSYMMSTDRKSSITDSYGHLTDTSLLFERAAQPAQIDESASWSRDFVAGFNNSIAARISHSFENSQPPFGHTQPTIFDGTHPQPEAEAYEDMVGNPSSNTPSLAPAFEFCPGKYDSNVGFVDEYIMSNVATAGRSYLGDTPIRQPLNDSSHRSRRSRSTILKDYNLSFPSDDDLECNHAASPPAKPRKRRQKQSFAIASRDKIHRCCYCDHAFDREEHLRRHEQSRHRGEETLMRPCAFHGCIDRKTGKQREISSRLDNLNAHYTKTHFKYGSSENGGKNERKSMKAAHEMGLNKYDNRWTLLLEGTEGKMDVNREIKDYLHVWKMLGYSIVETRDTRVKDVVPDWEGPHDQTLQKFDPRWKALWDGTLTLDKAMSIGKNMKETEAQGLLGVTMMETEAMGIKHLDPRWAGMLSGRMSVEQSEKLGVKQRNPVWKDLVARRRTR